MIANDDMWSTVKRCLYVGLSVLCFSILFIGVAIGIIIS